MADGCDAYRSKARWETVMAINTNTIKTTRASSLAVAPPDYNKNYQDQLNTQLRLYFAEVDGTNNSVIQAIYSQSVMNWLNTGSF